MSFVAGLANSLSRQIEERRRFVAEQSAQTRDYLERVYAQRQASAAQTRERLTAASDLLITRGFNEAEIGQLLENDPAELMRLGRTLDANRELSADDVRSVASFREDYMPELPLSELIQRAAPAIVDIDEPEPAARQQNIFHRLFGLNTGDERDRFLRETNIGGFSGYDILASVEASPYRTSGGGERMIDYGNIPTALTAAQRTDLTNGAELILQDVAQQISDNIRNLIEDQDISGRVGRQYSDAAANPRSVARLLFDDSDPLVYETLRPYREQALSELSQIYNEAPQIFTPSTFGDLGSRLASFNEAVAEEEGAAAAVDMSTIGITGFPEDEEERNSLIERLTSEGVERVVVTDPSTNQQVVMTPEEAQAWLSGEDRTSGAGSESVETTASVSELPVGSYTLRDGVLYEVRPETRAGSSFSRRNTADVLKVEQEVQNYVSTEATTVDELNPNDYERGSIVRVGSKLYRVSAVSTRGRNSDRNTFEEIGEVR